jgi:hypothetical protein
LLHSFFHSCLSIGCQNRIEDHVAPRRYFKQRRLADGSQAIVQRWIDVAGRCCCLTNNLLLLFLQTLSVSVCFSTPCLACTQTRKLWRMLPRSVRLSRVSIVYEMICFFSVTEDRPSFSNIQCRRQNRTSWYGFDCISRVFDNGDHV